MDFKYSLLRLTIRTVRLLPFNLGYGLAERCADIAFVFSSKPRHNIIYNLQRITGTEEGKSIPRKKVQQVFRNVAKNYFDLTKISQMRLEDIQGKVSIEGWDNLSRAVQRKKGVILATAHLGNFEFGAQVLILRGIDMSILVEESGSSSIMRNIYFLRQRKGAKILPINLNGMKDCLYTVLRGGTVIIVGDRDIQGTGVKVKFLGEETFLPVGAVSLAMRTGAALIPIFSVRMQGDKSTIYIEPEINLLDSGDRDQSVKDNLVKLAAIMEKYIQKFPEQWTVTESLGQPQGSKMDSNREFGTANRLFS